MSTVQSSANGGNLTRIFGRSLRTRLVVTFLLIGLAPLAAMGLFGYLRSAKLLRAQAGNELAELAFNAADKLDRNLFERYGDVQAYAMSDPARSMDPVRLNAWINTMMRIYSPIYDLMVVADAGGRIVAVSTVDIDGRPVPSEQLVGLDVSSSEWFRKARSGDLPEGTTLVEDLHSDDLVGKVYGSGSRSLAMSFTYPIRSADNRIIGVWTNRFSWRVAQDILTAVLDRAKSNGRRTARLTLVSRTGRVLAGDIEKDILAKDLSASAIVRSSLQTGAAAYAEAAAIDGSGRQELVGWFRSAGYATYSGLGWAALASQSSGEALGQANALGAAMLGIAFVGGALILIAAFVMARAITRPIETVAQSLHALAGSEADLSRRLPVAGGDEVGRLSAHFNEYMDNLEMLIKQVLRSGIQVTTSTTQIAAGARELEATVTEQVAATNEVVASAREITATANELARTMQDVSSMSDQTARSAATGQKDLSRMEASMAMMEEASRAVSSKLAVINEKAGNISSVVTTITKVADQTNLLSLNAAIEAEKAGQYGQGFSVVAREIRRLADQTAVATLDIEKMVRDMKTAVSSGVMTMDKFSDQVRQAVEAVREVGAQLSGIIDQVQAVTPGFEAVHQGMDAQSQGAQQISETMAQLSETTQQTAQALRETKRAIEELNSAAAGLQQMFARFRVSS